MPVRCQLRAVSSAGGNKKGVTPKSELLLAGTRASSSAGQRCGDRFGCCQQVTRGPFLACPVHATKAVGSKFAPEGAMISTLFDLLAIWTAVSFSIGLTWVTLCYACEGVRCVRQSRWGCEPAPSKFSSRRSWAGAPVPAIRTHRSPHSERVPTTQNRGTEGESAGIPLIRLTSRRQS